MARCARQVARCRSKAAAPRRMAAARLYAAAAKRAARDAYARRATAGEEIRAAPAGEAKPYREQHLEADATSLHQNSDAILSPHPLLPAAVLSLKMLARGNIAAVPESTEADNAARLLSGGQAATQQKTLRTRFRAATIATSVTFSARRRVIAARKTPVPLPRRQRVIYAEGKRCHPSRRAHAQQAREQAEVVARGHPRLPYGGMQAEA